MNKGKMKELDFNLVGKTMSTRVGGVEYFGEVREIVYVNGKYKAKCKFYNATEEYFYKEIA